VLLGQHGSTPTFDRVLAASVAQAFLPKFENEGQDQQIADQIMREASQK